MKAYTGTLKRLLVGRSPIRSHPTGFFFFFFCPISQPYCFSYHMQHWKLKGNMLIFSGKRHGIHSYLSCHERTRQHLHAAGQNFSPMWVLDIILALSPLTRRDGQLALGQQQLPWVLQRDRGLRCAAPHCPSIWTSATRPGAWVWVSVSNKQLRGIPTMQLK